jgi:GAF domain-containing protein
MKGTRGDRLLRIGLVAVCGIAALQILLGLGGLAAAAAGAQWQRPTSLQDWQRALQVLAFSGLAVHLLLGSRADPRVRHLGALLLLIAVFFAHPPILALAAALPAALARIVSGIRALPIDAFTPALTWLFFRDFPRALEGRRSVRVVSTAIAVSAAAALAVIAANVALALGSSWAPLARFDRANPVSLYWAVVFAPLLPVPVMLVWRTRRAPSDERRRVGLFAGGIAASILVPVAYAILPALSTSIEGFVRRPEVEAVLRPISLVSMFSIAAVTAYAVLVQRVLDVRTILRKAAQYALARGSVASLAGIPFALILVFLYRNRSAPIESLFSGAPLLRILALSLVGLLVLRLRVRVVAGVDRLFFREAYDAQQILADLAERSRRASSTSELAEALTREVDRALHLESIGLLVVDPRDGGYRPLIGHSRRLDRSSRLAAVLAEQREPLRVELDRPSLAVDTLSEEERIWIADSGAEVLVPMGASEGGLSGLLALGPKKSELRYTREDLRLLSAIGDAAGLALENLRLRDSLSARRTGVVEEASAGECRSCGLIEPSAVGSCPVCGDALRGARLPQTLFGKFHLEKRIGAGAMGVVYLAKDVELERHMALKTLPETSPEDSVRLRREARAMAAVRHPNLALIFGVESWRGTPVLVMEYLAGGTLAERIARGSLPVHDALDLGAQIAGVLSRLHASGLLHRDVKPSNVGFTEDGVPKLLDFGLARIAGETGVLLASTADGAAAPGTQSGLLGTPLYMSPEALNGSRSDESFDLWSLSVVIFEAIAGRHPFEQSTGTATYQAIRASRMLDLRQVRPGCSDRVIELFSLALAADRARRPSTARELGEWFRSATKDLAA